MKPMIIGNWKMNTTVEPARRLAEEICEYYDQCKLSERCNVVLCPPFVNIPAVREVIGERAVEVGAQNCWSEPYGAFTGEVSASMLRAIGCRYVIVGHSERRSIFHEDDQLILRKLERSWEEGLVPVLCIGETLAERQLHQTWNVLQTQLELVTAHSQRVLPWICAYEPVWAIGTGIAASQYEIEQAHSFLRSFLDARGCSHVPLLYGGSVTEENAPEIATIEHVNGVLVGGASITAKRFIKIIEAHCHD
jgi:triosephosphate isomerase